MTACSAVYRLAIANNSTAPLKVTYSLKPGKTFQPPQVLTVDEWKARAESRPLDAGSFTTDSAGRVRTIPVPPGQAVIIESGDLYPDRPGGMMDVAEIKLSGSSGDKSYSGESFYKELGEPNSSYYTIDYR